MCLDSCRAIFDYLAKLGLMKDLKGISIYSSLAYGITMGNLRLWRLLIMTGELFEFFEFFEPPSWRTQAYGLSPFHMALLYGLMSDKLFFGLLHLLLLLLLGQCASPHPG